MNGEHKTILDAINVIEHRLTVSETKQEERHTQNQKDIPSWQKEVSEGRLPIWRGVSLTTEDRLRRGIIESIMCHGEVHFDEFEANFGIDFNDHFALELSNLLPLVQDGLLKKTEAGFRATPEGRLLLRAIAMVFDEYFHTRKSNIPSFSRVI